MRVVGIEGTAWCASAAVFDTERDRVRIESDAYEPESGGIHPREAAEHMREAIPSVIEATLANADGPIDAVAFARGPGIGPCLRIVGSAARALAQGLDVPLVGVNHMVAHLEIGRHRSGFDSPVCLNASGANAHVLGYHNGRYRVLGETMDTGVGNALDKFTRHVGWSHPGGPKVEEHAKRGEYVPLPYVVKGMDFSFSGIMSAAKDAYDDGTPVEDVCRGLEETVFGMLTEVAERALSLTGRDELVLGGGVGQNARLRGMLEAMCEQRGAEFYAPEGRFLRDNAGMVAVLGAKMYAAGDTLAVADSAVDPDYRPDEVPVTWRGDAEDVLLGGTGTDAGGDLRGAEAIVDVRGDEVSKTRRPKGYRHDALDARLRRERTTSEARLLSEARRVGVPTPVLSDVDVPESTLTMARVGDTDLRDALSEERVAAVAEHLAAIHEAGFVHGDPTTRNARVAHDVARDERAGADATRASAYDSPGGEWGKRVHLIDFGLGYYTDDVEDYAMDLRVFEGSIRGTADDPDPLVAAAEAAYREAGDSDVVARLREVEERGRYR
ncbi:N6-L-threonylcarbamoyladenine synthase/protein kinase Bud32 [Halarchaeum rubridurum]|uniref:Probable bifunctional tRNA threonylcarbamoyladenosine biosynthesis protein n=1 Tax=Halarchaeum rubridurum TaxID=489911 RepID=A0A830FL46_9EURY|nr:bifunctional N(6)-L-threonylcarbamoyladenine synthase/serine/threonine protein kinase [Halarchaeum rubridurum]MBP1954156.1 N6-L-threonylcarbamoyladenine synthase/protein kinase Bud32 [Halarchaeum rubridurum]GGM57766.1 serine/threonine protein kinase [Halarchaeum rubridurum]